MISKKSPCIQLSFHYSLTYPWQDYMGFRVIALSNKSLRGEKELLLGVYASSWQTPAQLLWAGGWLSGHTSGGVLLILRREVKGFAKKILPARCALNTVQLPSCTFS